MKHSKKRARQLGLIAFVSLSLVATTLKAQDVLVGFGADWRYLDDGSDQGEAWNVVDFDDSLWSQGTAPLGAGCSGLGTEINNGGVTSYFRHTFTLPDPLASPFLVLNIHYDSGAKIYLNGLELAELGFNSALQPIDYSTRADSVQIGCSEILSSRIFLDGRQLPETNILAIEIHKDNFGEENVHIDAELVGIQEMRKAPLVIFTGNPSQMKITWQMQLGNSANCELKWGLSPGNLIHSIETTGNEYFQHEHLIDSLSFGTKYYYEISSTDASVETYNGSFFSAPDPRSTSVKFLAYGDTRESNVGGSFADHNDVVGMIVNDDEYQSGDYQTLILNVGDLTCAGMLESEWDNFFSPEYNNVQDLLGNISYQVIRGNHEGEDNVELFRRYFPYPFDGDGGGACWSFDYGPAHFVIVDQYDEDTYGIGKDQLDWIELDLKNTSKPWKFVCLHEPGWTAGGANEPEFRHRNNTQVQDDLQSVFVATGVSIVFAGHNHFYSRASVDCVQHLTIGGGGAPLYDPNHDSPNIRVSEKAFHYCKINIISETQMELTVINANGSETEIIENLAFPPTIDVAQSFENSLYASNGLSGILTLGVHHCEGEGFQSVVVDVRPINNDQSLDIDLRDDGQGTDSEADDGVFSSSSFNYYADEIGSIDLIVRVIGLDGVEVTRIAELSVVDGQSVSRYQDVSEDTGINYSGTPFGSAFLDYNKDERDDLLVSTFDTRPKFYECTEVVDGVPGFLAVTGVFPTPPPLHGWRGVSVADYNNDDFDDLFVADGLEPHLFKGVAEGGYRFEDSDALDGLPINNSVFGTWGDFDRDGYLDLFIGRSGESDDILPNSSSSAEQPVLLRNVSGVFTDVSSSSGLVSACGDLNCMAAAWCDYDSDGDVDLFVGENRVDGETGWHSSHWLENQDNGSFSDETPASFIAAPITGALWVDSDHSSGIDLAVSEDWDRSHVYYGNGTGGITSTVVLPTKGGCAGLLDFDFNLDGSRDILLLPNSTLEIPSLFSKNPPLGTNYANKALNAGLITTGRILCGAVSDFGTNTNNDPDGDPDLFLGKADHAAGFFNIAVNGAGAPSVGKSWIGISLECNDRANNSQGIGATVDIERSQYSQVVGGSPQADLSLVFGLGDEQGTVDFTVTWPDGFSQAINGKSVNQEYVIVYDGNPEVDSNLISTWYENRPQSKADLVFKWVTTHGFDPEKDKVTFISATCELDETELTPNTEGIIHTYSARPGGGYTHKIVWLDRYCHQGCSYTFVVSSASAGRVSVGEQRNLSLPLCTKDYSIQNPPNGG